MSQQYRTRQGETVDYIAWKYYGRQNGTAEAILKANTGLASYGPILPAHIILIFAGPAGPAPGRRNPDVELSVRPSFRLISNGVDVTARVRDRLLSLRFHDEAETRSDRLTVKLDARKKTGAHVEFPEIGSTLKLSLGYEETGVTYLGSFKVDEIEYSSPPDMLTIKAKAADMTGPFRTSTNRSWHNTTLGEIVSTIATENGYTLLVDPALGAVKIGHEDQTAESPMAFATRLAARHDGVVKPVNGALVLAAKGQAKTASGQSLPEFHVRPEKLAAWRYARRARTDAGTSEEGVGAVEAEAWSVDEAAPQLSRSGDGGAPQRQTYRLADLLAAQGSSASDANNQARPCGIQHGTGRNHLSYGRAKIGSGRVSSGHPDRVARGHGGTRLHIQRLYLFVQGGTVRLGPKRRHIATIRNNRPATLRGGFLMPAQGG